MPETSSEASRALSPTQIRNVMEFENSAEVFSDDSFELEGAVEGGRLTDMDVVELFGPTDVSSDEGHNFAVQKTQVDLSGVFDDQAFSSEEEEIPGGGKFAPGEVVHVDSEVDVEEIDVSSSSAWSEGEEE